MCTSLKKDYTLHDSLHVISIEKAIVAQLTSFHEDLGSTLSTGQTKQWKSEVRSGNRVWNHARAFWESIEMSSC